MGWLQDYWASSLKSKARVKELRGEEAGTERFAARLFEKASESERHRANSDDVDNSDLDWQGLGWLVVPLAAGWALAYFVYPGIGPIKGIFYPIFLAGAFGILAPRTGGSVYGKRLLSFLGVCLLGWGWAYATSYHVGLFWGGLLPVIVAWLVSLAVGASAEGGG